MNQTWTVPLNISISIGDPVITGSTPSARVTPARPAENVAADAAAPLFNTFINRFSIPSLTRGIFDWRTALSLALASRLVYSEKDEVESVGKGTWGLDTCEFFEVDDTQCFAATTDSVVLIAFRGTEAVGDWLGNLNAGFTNRTYGGQQVGIHRGFYFGFNAVRRQLEEVLSQNPDLPIVLAGHSLGGALALIAAAEWRPTGRVRWIHTIGQPAVGFSGFRQFITDSYRDNYFRYINNNDIVTMVPPGYSHAGNLRRFLGNGSLEAATEAVGAGPRPVQQETPTMTEEQFDELRSRLLAARAAKPKPAQQLTEAARPDTESIAQAAQVTPKLSDADVQRAVAETFAANGTQEAFGFRFPSISDHNSLLYVTNIARQAGFSS